MHETASPRIATPSEPRYSVVVPAFNSARTLPRTLIALERQTVADSMEVIVVDDGSTDDTASLAEEAGARVIRQPNRGPAVARNAGAKAARGEFILFTDADCAPATDFVERLVTALEARAADAGQGAYQTFQMSLVARFAQVEFEERYRIMQRYETIDLVATYAAAFRRDAFFAFDGFDESFPAANNEDTELSYRMAAANRRLVFAPEAVVRHLHPDSLRRYLRVKYWRGYWRMVVYRKFPDKALKDRYTPLLLKLQGLAAMALAPLAVVGVVFPPALHAATLLAVAIIASGLPFAARAARLDALVGLASPPLILCRALALGLGALHGGVRSVAMKRE